MRLADPQNRSQVAFSEPTANTGPLGGMVDLTLSGRCMSADSEG